ncbi:hypothetical protein AKJ09_04409 [Labilithrix luteola]|uniref:Type IV fimbrial biogenesis protein PilY1 n=1 Tax=Labilithrix luteola TaxID=1391654 RepID=A0A0K1PW51_9BACT|nr:hypothetical protein [Labilithrix luteola]AKU97745.1 hypothetical protein AKJ09_04409 [Labilithrix luteola]
MKARSLSLLAGLAAASAPALMLAACASDETSQGVVDDAAVNTVPTAETPDSDTLPDAGGHETSTVPEVPCTAETMCPTSLNPAEGPLDTRIRINTIQGRSANDVWAGSARGQLLHYDGTSWRRSDTGTTASINGLWLRTEGQAALASLVTLLTNEISLSVTDAGTPSSAGWAAYPPLAIPAGVTNPVTRITSTWSTPDAEWLWVGTLQASAAAAGNLNVNGLFRIHVSATTSKLELKSPFASGLCNRLSCRTITGLHGISADDLWAVGYTGATFRIKNAQAATPTIKAYNSQTWATLNAVWAASDTEAWAVGANGVIRHYTGEDGVFEVVDGVPTTEDLRAVWGTSPSDVWAVGNAATVLHYDGKTWSRVTVTGIGARVPDLYTVWTAQAGKVWIGGDGVLLSLGGES